MDTDTIIALPPVAPACAARTLRDAAQILENPGPGAGRTVTYQPPADIEWDHLAHYIGRKFVVTAVESHDLGEDLVVVLLDSSAVQSVIARRHAKTDPTAAEARLAEMLRSTAGVVEALELPVEELSVFGQSLAMAREVISGGAQ